MKKTVYLLLVILTCFACSKTDDEIEETPDFKITSDYYFAAVIDGDTIILQQGVDGYFNATTGGGSTTPAGYQEEHGAIFLKGLLPVNTGGFSFLKTFPWAGNCSEMEQAYGVGTFSYGISATSSEENSTDGIVVFYVDANGTQWSSGLLPATQNNSTFEITEYNNLETINASKILKAKFNCTLYDGNENSKTISKGELRAMIFNCGS